MADAARLRLLYEARDRLMVELKAVEDGTLPWLEERENATPAELAEAFGLTQQAANNRLARLVSAGLVTRTPETRDGGGRRYRYTVAGNPGWCGVPVAVDPKMPDNLIAAVSSGKGAWITLDAEGNVSGRGGHEG